MAASKTRRFFKTFFIVLNMLVCVLFLLACLTPFLNPAQWWLIGFLGLCVPYLIVLLVFSFIFWLIAKPKFVFIPIATLLIGVKQVTVVFAWHPLATFNVIKNDTAIRIVDWNVGSMYGLSKNAEIKKHNRTEIAESILKLQPDIICLQEFNHSYTQGPQADNIGLFSKQYPYFFFSKDYEKGNGFYVSGSIIFSKYPIIDSGKVKYPGRFDESLIYVDVLKGYDTMRIYTTHLQSFKFTDTDYADMEKIKEQDDEMLAASENIFRKMQHAFIKRGIQAAIAGKALDSCKHVSVLCGDFNDVPNSYAYFHIRGERQDAFLAKDFGVGRSYVSLAPTLRIDYILPDDHFNVLQFDMVDEGLSDHLMLVSDVGLKK